MNWLFIHVPRTAGSWLRDQIGVGCAKEHATHAPYRLHEANQDLADVFTFSIVRNPFERLVSLWALQVAQAPFDEWVKEIHGYWPVCSGPFSHKVHSAVGTIRFNLLWPQTFWLRTFRGIVGVDYLVRYERLMEDMQTVSERTGITIEAKPRIGKSDHMPFDMYYDDATRERVAEMYEDDLTELGYGC